MDCTCITMCCCVVPLHTASTVHDDDDCVTDLDETVSCHVACHVTIM